MLNAHSHSVTVLVFSDDGKMLATYAYGDSKVIVWQVSLKLDSFNNGHVIMLEVEEVGHDAHLHYSHMTLVCTLRCYMLMCSEEREYIAVS